MSAGPDSQPPPPPQWPGEAGAERLRDAVLAACASREDFPSRVEAALRAALGLLAADPELARLLTAQPDWEDSQALRAQRRWTSRFGALLRHAAAACSEASSQPFFVEPFLIGGIRFQIARRVEQGEAAQLGRLLPDALQFLLAYYLEPGEAGRIVRSAAAGGS